MKSVIAINKTLCPTLLVWIVILNWCMNSASSFLFQNTLLVYYFMFSIHLSLHLSTLPILIKSSLHTDVFLLILDDGSIIVCLWKLIVNKTFIMSCVIICSLYYLRAIAVVASLLSSCSYKYCALWWLIFIGSILFKLVTKFLSLVLSYKILM